MIEESALEEQFDGHNSKVLRPSLAEQQPQR